MAGSPIASLFVQIGADVSDLKKGLKESESLTNAAGEALKFAAAGATVAFGALATGIGVSVKAAMEAEKVDAQLNAVLKSTKGIAGVTADEINKMADALSQVTPFEDDAIKSGQSILLTFTNIGKKVFPQATEVMLDMSQALGQDLKSSALQLGKALQDPIDGVSALQRVGVNFTDAQKEQIKTLVESGNTMEAQKIILQELQTEFGGAAKAAGGTFAGQLSILQNQIGNIFEEIGMAFLPTLKELTSWVNKNVIPAITGLVDIFVKGEEPLGDWDAWWEKLRDAGGSEFADTVIGVTESVQDLLGVFSQFQSDISDRGVVDALADFATNLLIVGGVSEDQAVIIGEAIAEITDFIINAWNNDIHPALIEFKNWFDTDGRVALQNFYDKMQELSPYADQWLTLISDIRSALTDTKTAVDGLDLSFDLLGKRFSLVTETMNNFKQMADNAFATINQTQNAVAAAMRGDWLGAIDAISAAAVYAWKNSPIGQIAMLPGNIGRGIGEMIGNNLQGRANGGDVMANQPYIVGERGAEMFVPKQSGTIVPNGARGGVNININAPVYGVADLQAAIMGALNRYDRGLA